ncbi:MAG: sigma 54-interacting transcriptional regulator [Deltaproteobacteria bacterium]|nr:sigma 54-interacting transcriptional regulator [Deltaproteobacteria bacterium]
MTQRRRVMIKRPRPKLIVFHGMVSCAPIMLELFELVRRVAQTNASILIRGETGTGKELVAQAAHELSPRNRAPFMAVNCATLTSELLASELFGHVRGAFTGAVRDRQGLFARADGGTLFLDEVAEIEPDIQARLLRVLQEKAFVPLGATEPVSVDVRIFSATHKALRREVEQGRFRADLMYRIRVVPIFLPPLRDREGDVEALAWHFLDELNRGGGRQVRSFTADAMKALLSHDYPGNVRELRNVLEYAFAVGQGPEISLGDLTPEFRGEGPPPEPGARASDTAATREKARILDALDATGGKKAEAATRLGMSRSTLWRKMREHALS